MSRRVNASGASSLNSSMASDASTRRSRTTATTGTRGVSGGVAAASTSRTTAATRSRSSSLASMDLPDRMLPTDVISPPSLPVSPSRSTRTSTAASRRSSINDSVASNIGIGARNLQHIAASPQRPHAPNFPMLSVSQLDSIVMSPPKRRDQTSGPTVPLQPYQIPTHNASFYQSSQLGQTTQTIAAPSAPNQPQTQVHIHQYVSPPHHHSNTAYMSATAPLSPPTHPSGSPSLQRLPYQSQRINADGISEAHLYLPTPMQMQFPHSSQLQASNAATAGNSLRTSLPSQSFAATNANPYPSLLSNSLYAAPHPSSPPRSSFPSSNNNNNNSFDYYPQKPNSQQTSSLQQARTQPQSANPSESYARYAELNKNIRTLKIHSQEVEYAKFQGELNKELYVIALEHWAHKVYLTTFRSWAYMVKDRMARLSHFNTYRLGKRRRALFHSWIYVLYEKRRSKKLTIAAVEHWAFNHVRKFFLLLRHRVRTLHAKENDIILSKFSRIFKDWKWVVMQRLNEVQRIDYVQGRVESNARNRFFQMWKEGIYTLIMERTVTNRMNNSLLRSAYSSWRHLYVTNQRGQLLKQKTTNSLVRNAYSEWRYFYTLFLMASIHRSKNYSRVLLTRWIAAGKQHRKRLRLEKRARLYFEGQTLYTWYNLFIFNRQHKIASMRGDRLTLFHAFREWLYAYQVSRRAQLATRMAVGHDSVKKISFALQQWHAWTARVKSLKRSTSKLRQVRRFYLLTDAFAQWVFLRQFLVKQRIQTVQALQHNQLFQLRQMTVYWSNIVREKYGRAPLRRFRRTQRVTVDGVSLLQSSQNNGGEFRLEEIPQSPGREFASTAVAGGRQSLVFSPSSSEFYLAASSTVPSRITGETRLQSVANTRVFVPYHAQLQMSELYYAHRKYRLIMQRWKSLSSVGAALNHTLQTKADILYVHHLLQGWSRSARRNAQMNRAIRTTQQKDRNILMATAYNSWVLLYNRVQYFNRLINNVDKKYLEKLWLNWRLALKSKQTNQLKLRWFQMNFTVKQFYFKWKEQSGRNALLQRALHSFALRLERDVVLHWKRCFALELKFLKVKHSVMKICWFRCWKRQASIAKELEHMVKRLEKERPKNQLNRLFQYWKNYYFTLEQHRHIAQLQRLKTIYSLWQRRAYWSRFDRTVIESFRQRALRFSIARHFSAWNYRLHEQRIEQTTARRAAVHFWVRWVSRLKRARDMKKLSAISARASRLSRALHAFQAHAERRSYVRKQNTRAEKQYDVTHLQSIYFAAILKFISLQRRAEIKADAVWGRKLKVLLMQTLKRKYAWRTEARDKLGRVVPFIERPLQNLAIQSWRRYAASHKIIRRRMETFEHVVAQRMRAIYIHKLLSDAMRDWRIGFVMHTRNRALSVILVQRTKLNLLKRSLKDWMGHIQSGMFLKRQLQRRAVGFLAYRARTRRLGRVLKHRTQMRIVFLVYEFWRMKSLRIFKHRFLSNQFRQERIIDKMKKDSWQTWRESFLLLRGPLAQIHGKRHTMQMHEAVQMWIDTLNRRQVYRWAVQLFKQRLQALLDHELHKKREVEQAKAREVWRLTKLSQGFDATEIQIEEYNQEVLLSPRQTQIGMDYDLQHELATPTFLPRTSPKRSPLRASSPQKLAEPLLDGSEGLEAPIQVAEILPEKLAQPIVPFPSDYTLTLSRFTAISQRWRTLDLTIPFLQWRDVHRARKARMVAYIRAATHERIRKLRLTFQEWTQFIQRARRAHVAIKQGDVGVLKFVMNRWTILVRMEKQATLAAQLSNTALVRESYYSWRSNYLWIVRLRNGDVNSVHYWARRILTVRFKTWKHTATKFRQLAEKQRVVTMNSLYKLQYKAFAQWLNLYVMSRTKQTQETLALNHYVQGLLKRAMFEWNLFKNVSREKKHIVQEKYLLVHVNLLRNVWEFWKEKFHRVRTIQLRLKLFLANRFIRTQATRFLGWRKFARKQRDDRLKILSFIRSRLLKAGWKNWRVGYATQVTEAQKNEQARLHQKLVVNPGRMRSALLFWKWNTDYERTLATRLWNFEHLRFAPKFFRGWQEYVKNKRASWRFYRIRAQEKFLRVWFERFAESKFLRVAQAKIDLKCDKTRLINVMQAWRVYARRTATLRDAARMLVTSRGGCPIYSHGRVLSAMPSPSSLPRTPAALVAVRDEERQRWLENRALPRAAHREVRATLTQRSVAGNVNNKGHRAALRARQENPFSDSPSFDPEMFPLSRPTPVPVPTLNVPVSTSTSVIPRSNDLAPLTPTIRSIEHPDPAARALYSAMCVGFLSFEQIGREVSKLASAATAKDAAAAAASSTINPISATASALSVSSTSSALVPISSALTAFVPSRLAADDTDGDALLVYSSPLLQLKSLFSFWFTSALMLRRAREDHRRSRQRRVFDAFKLFQEKRSEIREKNQASATLRARQMERHAFRLWVAGAQLQKNVDEQARELYWDASKRMAVRNAPRMLQFWLDYAIQRRLIRTARERWDTSSIRYGLSVWSWRAQRSKKLKDTYKTLWVKHHKALLDNIFNEWRVKSLQNAAFKRICPILERLHGEAAIKQWYAASLTTKVEAMQRALKEKKQSAAVSWIRQMARVTSRHAVSMDKGEQLAASHIMRIQRGVFRNWYWNKTETARIRMIKEKHAALVLKDFYIAWREGTELAKNIRLRDDDFTRILTMRNLSQFYTTWRSHYRLQVLERRVMERHSKEHLTEWVRLIMMNKVYQTYLNKRVWVAWKQYVVMRRYAVSRAARFRELVLSRSVLKHWRFTLLTPAQKAAMVEVALHLWRSSKRRRAGVMFGHWRALAKAKRFVKPVEIQEKVKSRLSSMAELNHLVKDSSIARAHLHSDRSRSASPVITRVPAAMPLSASRSVSRSRSASRSHSRAASRSPSISRHRSPPKSILHSPSSSPFRASTGLSVTIVEAEKHTAAAGESHEEKKYVASPPRSARRHTSAATSAAASVSRIELPTASRATLSSLRTFLGSPAGTQLRVNHHDESEEEDYGTVEERASSPSTSPTRSSGHIHVRQRSSSSEEDEQVLRSPTGRHSMFMQIPPAAVKASSPARPAASAASSQRFDRSLHASQLRY